MSAGSSGARPDCHPQIKLVNQHHDTKLSTDTVSSFPELLTHALTSLLLVSFANYFCSQSLLVSISQVHCHFSLHSPIASRGSQLNKEFGAAVSWASLAASS